MEFSAACRSEMRVLHSAESGIHLVGGQPGTPTVRQIRRLWGPPRGGGRASNGEGAGESIPMGPGAGTEWKGFPPSTTWMRAGGAAPEWPDGWVRVGMRLMAAVARVTRKENKSSRARVGGWLSEARLGPEPVAALVGSDDSSSARNAASEHSELALSSEKKHRRSASDGERQRRSL